LVRFSVGILFGFSVLLLVFGFDFQFAVGILFDFQFFVGILFGFQFTCETDPTYDSPQNSWRQAHLKHENLE